MVKKHARANAQRYLNPEHTTRTSAMAFSAAVNEAMKQKTGSTAVVLTLDKAVENAFRDNWEPNDRIVAIIRNGNTVTIMLSRQGQINRSHLRTDTIVRV